GRRFVGLSDTPSGEPFELHFRVSYGGSMVRRVLLLFLLLSPLAFSQAKHPFTFDDMMALKRVGDPILSPDNKWIVFPVVHVDLAANSKTPHLWLIPANGGEAKQLTDGPGEDSPRWSPDTKHILYTSARDSESQIWVSDFDAATGALTGDPRKITSISTGADGALWSPDG